MKAYWLLEAHKQLGVACLEPFHEKKNKSNSMCLVRARDIVLVLSQSMLSNLCGTASSDIRDRSQDTSTVTKVKLLCWSGP